MPDFIKNALQERKLVEAYNGRPEYQRNDYISWIERAKQEQTINKRLSQMLDELEAGGIYMNMKHNASSK